MKLEGSLLCLQKPGTGTHPMPNDPVEILTPYFCKACFNIILSFTPSTRWSQAPPPTFNCTGIRKSNRFLKMKDYVK
jgi:hypothetical protein